MKVTRQSIFWIITCAAFFGLLLPVLVQDGMFMDGVQYACVSKNLANGLGSFWFPFLSETWWKAGSPYFMEHPPLVYGIQSLFFKILGDGMYTERIYSLVCALITAILIIKTWNLISVKTKELSWLPVLLWIITPLVFWSYRNNLMENTLGIFTLSAIYFGLLSLKRKDRKYIWLLLAGLSIFMASLSKGVPGLFPLSFFLFYWISHQAKYSFRQVLIHSSILLVILFSAYALVLINDNARESLLFYFNDRLMHRIDAEPTVTNRFDIIYRMFMELLPAIVITVFSAVIFKIKKLNIASSQDTTRNILLFFMLGASASFPLLLTSVQRGFYLLPAFPFFAITFALLIAPHYQYLIKKVNPSGKTYRLLFKSSLLLPIFVLTITTLQIGKTSRNQTTITDVNLIGSMINTRTIIDVTPSVYNNWEFQFYMLRKFNSYLRVTNEPGTVYYISKNSSLNIGDYERSTLKTNSYHLFIKSQNGRRTK